MEILYETIRNICAFVILTTVVNNLLHESTYQKYIRFFSGLVLILIVIKPIAGLMGDEDMLFNSIEKYLHQVEMDELENELRLYEDKAYSDASEQYVDMLDNALGHLAEEHGLTFIGSEWELDMDAENNGPRIVRGLSVTAGMSGDVDISDIRVSGDGTVSMADEPNGSMDVRGSAFKEAVTAYFCINKKDVHVSIIP